MEKDVNFFRIHGVFKPIVGWNSTAEKQNEALIEELNSEIIMKSEYIIKEKEKSNTIIAILERDRSSMFGILTKREDLMDGVLRKITNQNDDQKLSDVYVDDFTYFYVDTNTLYCVVLDNYKAPRFRKNFESFLNEQLKKTYDRVSVNSVYDDNIEAKISEISSILDFDIIYDSIAIGVNDIVTINEAYGIANSSIIRAAVKLTVKPEIISPVTKGKLLDRFKHKRGYSKFDLTVIDNDQNEIELDLVEGLLRKKITIEIDKDLLTVTSDFKTIKKALKDSLLGLNGFHS